MTIREKVARAGNRRILNSVATALLNANCTAPGFGLDRAADLAINAFLAAAAEPDEETGISWHMRPDEATEEMVEAIMKGTEKFEPDMLQFCRHYKGKNYVAMLAAAPEFDSSEWDK